MPQNSSRSSFRTSLVTVSAILILQTTVFYMMPRDERTPGNPDLAALPNQLASWRMVQESEVEQEVMEVLKADKTLSRMYVDESNRTANLFVAFFRTQRAGVSPHSPKVCLPGSGWVPVNSMVLALGVPGMENPIEINRYTIAKGDQKSVVLYWYQSHNRIVASEYAAKLYTMLDSIRYRRSDTSLIRVVVPVTDGKEIEAQATAEQFVRSFFDPLRKQLPT